MDSHPGGRLVLVVLFWSQLAGLTGLVVWVVWSGAGRPGVGAMLAALGAGFAGVAGLACLYRGLAVGAMGIVAPISATSPVVPLVVDIGRGRSPGTVQWIGIVVALAGVVLVSRQPGPGRAPVVAAGVGLALAAALGFGLFVVGLGVAAQESPSWAAATARFASVCTVVAALAATRTSVRCSQRLLPLIVAVGIFDAGANALDRRGRDPRVDRHRRRSERALSRDDDPAGPGAAPRAPRRDPSRRRADRSRGCGADRRRMMVACRDRSNGGSDVEADVQDVAVLDDVRLALEALQRSLRGLRV